MAVRSVSDSRDKVHHSLGMRSRRGIGAVRHGAELTELLKSGGETSNASVEGAEWRRDRILVQEDEPNNRAKGARPYQRLL